MISLTQRIVVLEKPKSTAKLWSLIDTYPAELSLSLDFKNVSRGYTNSISVTVLDNGKRWGSSALNVKSVIYGSNFKTIE